LEKAHDVFQQEHFLQRLAGELEKAKELLEEVIRRSENGSFVGRAEAALRNSHDEKRIIACRVACEKIKQEALTSMLVRRRKEALWKATVEQPLSLHFGHCLFSRDVDRSACILLCAFPSQTEIKEDTAETRASADSIRSAIHVSNELLSEMARRQEQRDEEAKSRDAALQMEVRQQREQAASAFSQAAIVQQAQLEQELRS
jgi:hypothetical protein